MNGRARIGFHGYNGSVGSGSSTVKISSEFQTKMQQVYPEMVAEFRGIGAPLGISVEELRLEAKPSKEGKGKRDGVLKKLIGKIRDVLGLTQKNGEKKRMLRIEGN